MAKVTDVDGGSIEVKDNTELEQPCEELGVAFGCNNGLCHSCRIEIIEGEENLTEYTEQEKHGKIDQSKDRLACQCKILKGEVKYQY